MSWKRKRLEALDNEDINDVHLVGTDGKEVPCCKAYLAPMSPVFMSMFYRGFKEETSDRCSLDFQSLVISVIVKYCYCGEVDIDLIFNNNKSLEEEATLLVELREAGRYFEIEELSSTAEAKIANLVFQEDCDKKKYQFASVFLTELHKLEEHNEPLGLLLYRFVAENTMECFCPRDPENNSNTEIYHAHPYVLANVLQNHEDDYSVVKCLQRWFFLESKSAGHCYSDEDKLALIKIAENIDLKSLSTRQLSNIKPCSLFSGESIIEAFAYHCKGHEINTEIPRTKPRVHVSGAGMEHLNGSYKQTHQVKTGEKLSVFSKRVNHNGTSCRSLIHRKCGESKWLISISKNDGEFDLHDDDSVHENSIQIHVYEASYESSCCEDPKIPPFNSWKCIEGTGRAPLVACIYQKKIEARGN